MRFISWTIVMIALSSGCASEVFDDDREDPNPAVSRDTTITEEAAMTATFTEIDVLNDLDDMEALPYKFFLDLDAGYTYTASSRITLFADEHHWAICMEKSGYNPRAGSPVDVEVNFFGNCLHNLDNFLPGRNYRSNTKYFPLISSDQLARIEVGDSHELVSPDADTIKVRDRHVAVEHDISRYEAKGIETWPYDNPQRLPDFPGLVRYLSEEHPGLFRATEEELRTCLPSNLPKLMVIDRWVHPEQVRYSGMGGPGASSCETFQTIARILSTRDTSLWKEPAAPNNDWRFHPDAGSL